MDEKVNKTKMSPLYTSIANEKLKRAIIKDLGKDKDGAYRVANRLDKQSIS